MFDTILLRSYRDRRDGGVRINRVNEAWACLEHFRNNKLQKEQQ